MTALVVDLFGESALAPVDVVPTVEAINTEHRLATRKAGEAVHHAANCGRMLLQIKASKAHGEWLPWLTGEIEAGRLEVKARQARSYMQLAANWQRDANLVEAPSIRAALELLSDKEPAGNDGQESEAVSAATVTAMLADLPVADQRAVLTALPEKTVVAVANTIRRDRGALQRTARLSRYPAASMEPRHAGIIATDIRLLTDKDIASESVDCIITDPPYPKEYIDLFDDLGALAARVLKPGGSLIAMTGQAYLPDYLHRLSRHLTYRWTLAYHTPGHNTQAWGATVINAWKPLLWFTKGKAEKQWWINDFVVSPLSDKDKKHHDWGQSVSGMTEIVKRFTNPGDVVLDPFLGGGATGLACLELNRRFIGVEIDADVAQQATSRIEQFLKVS